MSRYSKDDIIRMVHEDDVEFIRMQFTDIFGQLKNVAITASQIEKAVNNEIMIDGSSIEGFVRIQESDQYLRPDLDTFHRTALAAPAGQGSPAAAAAGPRPARPAPHSALPAEHIFPHKGAPARWQNAAAAHFSAAVPGRSGDKWPDTRGTAGTMPHPETGGGPPVRP